MKRRVVWSTRLVRERVTGEVEVVRGPADVARAFRHDFGGDRPHECFVVFYMNTRHEIIGSEMVTQGIVDASLVHPREVFRLAIKKNASAIVLVHNHPSGDPTPSPEDRKVTGVLVEAGQLLGIAVLDHVVVGNGSHRSILSD